MFCAAGFMWALSAMDRAVASLMPARITLSVQDSPRVRARASRRRSELFRLLLRNWRSFCWATIGVRGIESACSVREVLM